MSCVAVGFDIQNGEDIPAKSGFVLCLFDWLTTST